MYMAIGCRYLCLNLLRRRFAVETDGIIDLHGLIIFKEETTMKDEFMKLASRERIKRVQILKEQGYSCKMISRFLDIPETEVRFMVRRE